MADPSHSSTRCDLSVVIVNWNLKDYLLEAVTSVLDSVKRHRFEILVVDNASTDGSADAVRRQFPEVRLVENRENVGFGQGNNLGFEIAHGRYFLLLNNDARLLPGAADHLVDYADGNPEIGICGGQLLNPDGSNQNSFDNFPSLATELLNKSVLRRLFPARFPSKLQSISAPRDVEVVIGAMMLIRSEVISSVGGFDPGYFMFLEETDLCFRVKNAGHRVMQLPEAKAIHHQGTSSVRRLPGLSRIEYYRSLYRYFRKWRSPAVSTLLKAGCFLKLFPNLVLNLAAGLLTLFRSRKARERIAIYSTVLLWHLKGCPDEMGLQSCSDRRPTPAGGEPEGVAPSGRGEDGT